MDGKRLLIGAAAVLAGGCAPLPQVEPVPPPIIHREPPRPPASGYPARLEVLDFQQYGREVADRAARDPNFGGFIFRSEPEPHAIVMFTGNAEARLRRYTSDPRFRAQRVELTLAQLEAMKDAFGGELSRLGLRCFSVDGDEEHNTVTVGAPADELAKVQAAIRSGAIKAPRKLRLVEQGCPTWR